VCLLCIGKAILYFVVFCVDYDDFDGLSEIIKLIYDEYRDFIEDPVNVSQDIQKMDRDFSNSVLALSTTVSIMNKADPVDLAGFDPNGEVADTSFCLYLDHAEPLRPLILGLLGFDVQEESIASIADSISE